MVSIEISDEQREYLEQLRVQLAAEHVGTYGHVRTRDALQYLIDNHEADKPAESASASTTTADTTTTTEAAAATANGDVALEPETESAVDADETPASTADTDDAAGDEAEADGAVSGPGRLQRMMGLLDDHEDKWDEVESNQGKYVVELPDGDHEFARTKDEVRAVLFKNYR